MEPGFLVTGGFSSLLVPPPSWRDPCMEAALKFLISKDALFSSQRYGAKQNFGAKQNWQLW